jgi:hypothetical protein
VLQCSNGTRLSKPPTAAAGAQSSRRRRAREKPSGSVRSGGGHERSCAWSGGVGDVGAVGPPLECRRAGTDDCVRNQTQAWSPRGGVRKS